MEKNEGVLDAGPLIHLSELNALDALRGFRALLVSPTVISEVKRHQPDALLFAGLTLVVEFQIEPASSLLAIGQALLLDRGELEALALVQTHPNAVFFTDDSAARLVAEQMGIRTHGTLGLLIRMARQGYREPLAVINLLEQIPTRSTLHISKKLLDEVLQRLKKEWGLE